MATPNERLIGLVSEISVYLPEALGDDGADVSTILCLSGTARAVLNATLEPPTATVRILTPHQPTEQRGMALQAWSSTLLRPSDEDKQAPPDDDQAEPDVVLRDVQSYELTPHEAALRRLPTEHISVVDEQPLRPDAAGSFVEAIAKAAIDAAKAAGNTDSAG